MKRVHQVCVLNVLFRKLYSLLCAEEPPLEYWKVLAEQRRQALADTLLENEEVKGVADV